MKYQIFVRASDSRRCYHCHGSPACSVTCLRPFISVRCSGLAICLIDMRGPHVHRIPRVSPRQFHCEPANISMSVCPLPLRPCRFPFYCSVGIPVLPRARLGPLRTQAIFASFPRSYFQSHTRARALFILGHFALKRQGHDATDAAADDASKLRTSVV
jgi:hypothetical protein